jgi:hypothetical protein
MKAFSVEGLIQPKGGRARKTAVKPFSQSFWANTPQEAIQMALESLPGSVWVEGPFIRTTSEEQRMRALGAPELPGLDFFTESKKKQRK